MLFVDFLTWWYGLGWLQRVADLRTHISNWVQFFSLGTLIKTLFKPWKQIVSSAGPNGGLGALKDAIIDNTISRFVGFFVRITVLIFAMFVMIFVLLFNLAYVLLWPLIPIAPLILIVIGISR